MSVTPEAAVGQILDNSTAVTEIRGDNLWSGPVPQKTPFPYQTVLRVDRPYWEHMLGVAPVARAIVQVDTYSDDAEEAERLAEISRDTLLAHTASNVTMGGESLFVKYVHIQDDDATDERHDDGNHISDVRRVRQDYAVGHTVI